MLEIVENRFSFLVVLKFCTFTDAYILQNLKQLRFHLDMGSQVSWLVFFQENGAKHSPPLFCSGPPEGQFRPFSDPVSQVSQPAEIHQQNKI